jgi:hypothetical protein
MPSVIWAFGPNFQPQIEELVFPGSSAAKKMFLSGQEAGRLIFIHCDADDIYTRMVEYKIPTRLLANGSIEEINSLLESNEALAVDKELYPGDKHEASVYLHNIGRMGVRICHELVARELPCQPE